MPLHPLFATTGDLVVRGALIVPGGAGEGAAKPGAVGVDEGVGGVGVSGEGGVSQGGVGSIGMGREGGVKD